MISVPSLLAQRGKLNDWFSPILIKELRQGMRARAFVLSFMLIQLFLILVVLGNLAANGERNALEFQSRFFWVIIGFALLLLMPLRGLVAITQEVKNHTMETILLTRLTAWRVVFGKWSALFAQSLLFVSAVLPYVVLRYFVGGDDLIADFELLALLLWASGLLIAASIAISAIGNGIIRLILIILGGWLVAVGGSEVVRASGVRTDSEPFLVWLFIFGFFVPALLFEFTATSIAPTAENHAIRRRLLALAFFILSSLVVWDTGDDLPPGTYLPIIVLVAVCYFDLGEKPRLFLRMARSFWRLGWMGRIAALFLLPGWPAALLFSLAVIPTGIWVHSHIASVNYKNYSGYDVPLIISAVFGSVLVPLVVCHLFWKKMKQVALMIILYNILLFGITVLLDGFNELTHANINRAFAFLPGLPLYLTGMGSDIPVEFIPWCLFGNIVVVVVLAAILLLGSWGYFRDLFALMRRKGNDGYAPDHHPPETPNP